MLNRPASAISEAWKAVGRTFEHYGTLRLAVSGGADSLAMLVGFVRLRDAGLLTAALEVVTVDHGLRSGSAQEAVMVAETCRRLGVPCHVATLAPSKVIRNKQAWARKARYQILADLGDRSNPVVLTAHTADDQAETVLMRAARGAGSEGLTGIRSPVCITGALVYRPFLAWKREELRGVLEGTAWEPAQDPSNADEAYTRVRFRRWLAEGPVPDSERSVAEGLAETARIAQLESAAIGHYADQLVSAIGGAQYGFADGQVAFLDNPCAVQARFLRTLLAMVARLDDLHGSRFNASFDLARMVKLAARVENEPAGRWVGGGVVLDWRHAEPAGSQHMLITAFAEAGRTGFPVIEVEAGETAIWDGRFEVDNPTSRSIEVRAWTGNDPRPRSGDKVSAKKVLASLPVAVQAGEVIAWADTSGAGPRQGLPTLQAVRRILPA